MKNGRWIRSFSVLNKSLKYRLNIIFGLFFLLPVAGFFYLGVKYRILEDHFIPLFFAIFLFFSFLGFILLRKIFDDISHISDDLKDAVDTKYLDAIEETGEDELRRIASSFVAIGNQFKSTFGELERKISEVSVLKELSDLCYVTFDQEELLYVTLERALKLANADVGSILILERPERTAFVVRASMGLGDIIKIGDKVNFSTSIAKYAVINKSAVVVENIEKDTRFGRENRSQYGTKSFACLPIKTIKDIIGVLTISRKDDSRPMSQADIEALSPLLSNAAFTYENLRLLREREEEASRLASLDKSLKVINSGYSRHELLHALLNEIYGIVPYTVALVFVRDERKQDTLLLFDYLSYHSRVMPGNNTLYATGPIFDKVLRQEQIVIIDDTTDLSEQVSYDLILEHKACLMAPLRTHGGAIGMLVLCVEDTRDCYEEKMFIESMTAAIAMAIEKNRINTAVERKNQEVETLRQIGSFLTCSTFDISMVLKYTMDMIKVVMDVEAGSLLLLKNNELEFTVSFNMDVGVLRQHSLKLGQGIAGYVAARGEPMIVNEVSESPHYYGEVDKTTGFQTRSALCVPIISQGKVIGVIEVLNKVNGEFTLDDLHLLQSVTSSVTIALENARLYRETLEMAEQERNIRQMFQKFVPEKIVNEIIHGRTEDERKVIEEYRMLTLLNIDIRGFSEMARNIGPRKTVAVLNYFFSIMGEIVFKYQGIVDKYLGDGFLAIFGAPVSSGHDVDNAVQAALEMKEIIPEVNSYCRTNFGVGLGMGISINTGEVIVGNIGFEKKMDYTVIGDQVNTVFRIQYLAREVPNGILISERTLHAARARLDVREVERGAIGVELGGQKIYELLGRVEQDG